jgi:hypothetical protein
MRTNGSHMAASSFETTFVGVNNAGKNYLKTVRTNAETGTPHGCLLHGHLSEVALRVNIPSKCSDSSVTTSTVLIVE